MRTLLALTAVLLAGCFQPKIGEGEFMCGPNRLCPSGFVCGGNRCFTPENLPAIDMAPQVPFVGSGKLGDLDVQMPGTDVGPLVFNTRTGEIKFKNGPTLLAAAPTPLTGDGFSIRTQANGGTDAALWEFDSFRLASGVTAIAEGEAGRALAIAATGTLDIAGVIDLRVNGGFRGINGEDGQTKGDGTMGGGGKGAGGSAGRGGGSGGYGAEGQAAPNGGGAGGKAFGDAQMTVLHVGAGGGSGAGAADQGGGGNGGGAVALLAKTILLTGTIDVSGSTPPNATGATMCGGGGGGAGGSIMLSGNQLTLSAGHKLRALGGMGGEGVAGGTPGGAGAIGRIWSGALNVTVTAEDSQPGRANSTLPLFEFPRPKVQ